MDTDGFDWDWANSHKNLVKHGVTEKETEEVFLNGPMVFEDAKHSHGESRSIAFGQTNSGKLLAVAFTLRQKDDRIFIRPISSRPMHKKERIVYEKAVAKNEKS